MILKLVRTPGIYLVGFMGSGKSTVGRVLADRLGWNFVDLDEEIEAEQGTTIPSIFDTAGEARFREIETEAIRKWVRKVRGGRPTVLALGGGAFVQPENLELLQDHGVTIWLDIPLEQARQRVEQASNRPLARDPVRFGELFEDRRSSYARADYRVEVSSDDPEVVADAICALPIF